VPATVQVDPRKGYSVARLFPSTKPVSSKPRPNAATAYNGVSALSGMEKLTTGIAGCRARAAGGQAERQAE
jgi:hypothetical protein